MLDSNIFDELIKDHGFVRRIQSLVKSKRISLYITHIQKEQISHANIKKAKRIIFDRLLMKLNIVELKTTGVLLSDENDIPLAKFPFEFSEYQSYDTIRGNSKKYKIALDAAIAQTAFDNGLDYIVTNDKDFDRNYNPFKIDFEEFKKAIDSLLTKPRSMWFIRCLRSCLKILQKV